jgi:hypothetical protein
MVYIYEDIVHCDENTRILWYNRWVIIDECYYIAQLYNNHNNYAQALFVIEFL